MQVYAHAHTPRKKWTQYFWDFFLLFLAVTLGFIVENRREHYIEHKRAKRYLKNMRLDVGKNISDLDSLIESNTKLAVNYESLLRELFRDSVSIDRYSIAKRIFPTFLRLFVNRNETFEQMKSSGSLRYLENQDLLNQIVKYYRLADFTEWRAMENERKVALEQTYPLLNRNFDPQCLAEEIADTFSLGIHVDILRGEELKKFRNEVSSAVITRLKFMKISMQTYVVLRNESNTLLKILDDELR